MRFEYECAVSGVTEVGGDADDRDGMDDLPVGWTRVQMTRRQYNPKWVFIQQVKEAMIEGLLSQFPDELKEMQRYPVTIQIEAQFHSLEADTPKYEHDIDDVFFLSDDGEVVATLNQVRELVGLEPVVVAPDDESEEIEEADDAPKAIEEATDGGDEVVPAEAPASAEASV